MKPRGGRPRKLPSPWVVLQLLKCGWTQRDIANSYGVDSGTVWAFVQRHKHGIHPYRAPHPKNPQTYDTFLTDHRRDRYEPELPTGLATDGEWLNDQHTELSDCADLLREWGCAQEVVGR